MTPKAGELMSGNTKHSTFAVVISAIICGLIFSDCAWAAELGFETDTTLVLDNVSGTFTIYSASEADNLVIEANYITVTVAAGDVFVLGANNQQRLVNTANLTDCWPVTSPVISVLGPATVTITPLPGPCVASQTSGSDKFYNIYNAILRELPTIDRMSSVYDRKSLLNSDASIDEVLGFSGIPHPLCPAGDLLKGSLSTVYYCGQDGRRHAFPQENVFFSWYGENFSRVRQITDYSLAIVPLGGNMTHRPGLRLIKIQSDPRVYAVSGRSLRWVEDEATAQKMYGLEWNKFVDDIADIFFTDYVLGLPITQSDVVE